MNISPKAMGRWLALSLPNYLIALAALSCSNAAEAPKDSASMVPLMLKLPPPAFKGTPKDLQLSSYVEPLSDKPRPPMMVPAGLKNVALGKKLTSSDTNATATVREKSTDGDKVSSDQSIIFLRRGTQWVQMDLGSPHEIFAIVIWHAHNTAKVYRDVIVKIADDPDFTKDVRTLFNNDQDNSW